MTTKLSKSQLRQQAIIKVFNEQRQRYVTVQVPSGLTVGAGDSEFTNGIRLYGPIEFKTTTAPEATSMKLYAVGSTLYFNGSEVGSGGGGGAPVDAQYVTLATDSTLTNERVLTAGSNITITDGGAGSTVTIAASAGAGGWTDDGTDVRLTTATDQVGIGTASPGTKLEVEVADSENLGGLLIDFNETGSYNALEIDSESTASYAAWIHGKYPLWCQQDISGGRAITVSRNIAEAGSYPLAQFVDDHTSNTQTTVKIQQDGTGDILNLFDGATEVLTVLDGGNVGIGTDAPSTTLHVVGDAVTIGNGATGPGEIRLLEDTDLGSYYAGFKAGNLTENTVYEMPTAYPASNKVLQSDSSGVLTWVIERDLDNVGWTAPGTGEIATTGSVAIGVATSPAERLEVKDANGTATTVQVNNTSTGDPQFSLAVAGTKKCTWGIDNDDSDKFKLGTTACSTGTVLTIDFDYGYAGFGTETPAEALEVETGAAGQTTTTIQVSNTATTGDPQLAFALSGTKKFTMGVDDSDSDKFKIGTTACSTSTRLTIDADGVITVRGYTGGTAGSAVSSFDKNLVIGGAYNQSYNSGDAVLLWIGDYSNDGGDDVYPIYVEDENNNVAFYLNGGTSADAGRAYFGGQLGIAASSPMNRVQVNHSGSNGDDGILIVRSDPTTADGDLLGGIGFDSTDGNVPSSITEAAAFIAAYAAEAHSTGDKGGDLVFGTTTIDDNDDTTSHEWMRILDSGEVGIGTASPQTKLTIEGAVTLKEQSAADSDTAAYGQIWVKDDTPNTLYFTDDDGTDHRLGAGTVTSGSFNVPSPSEFVTTASLSIAGGEGFSYTADSVGTDTYFFVSGSIDSRGSSTKGTAVFGGDVVVSGTLSVNRSDAGGFSMVTITTDGKLGIGTDNPGNKLSVGGNMDLGEYLYQKNDQDTYIRFQSDDIDIQAGGVDLIKMSEDGANTQVLILSGGAAASANEASYTDTNFFVSGSGGSKDTSTRGTAVFGGDVVISGTLHGGTPLKIAGGMEVTGTMELKPSAGGVAIVRNPHGPVKLFASSALKLGSNIGTIDLLDLGDGAAGQVLMKGQGTLAERSVELNSPGTLFFTGSVGGAFFKGPMDVDGNIVPHADNAYDLGAASRRFRNIYTGDLHLQNERGHWQIIEERDYLCVVNRLTGKRYKMMLEPIDDDEQNG